MKTLVKGIEVKKAIEIAKPFVGSLRKKLDTRPVLKTALITEEHVIATDSHVLIRIKHNTQVSESYLHHYKAETNGHEAIAYPDTSRLMPEPSNAKQELTINIAEWFEAHELALVAAKERKGNVVLLEGNKISAQPVRMKAVASKNKSDYSTIEKAKGFKDVRVPEYDQIAFSYALDTDTGIEKVAYNCEYMLMMLKVFKKLKIKEITCYFFGPHRPMLFKDNNDLVEILVLPVRTF